MNTPPPLPLSSLSLPADRLPPPVRDEASLANALSQSLAPALSWPAVATRARPWVEAVRRQPAPFWALESLMREYPISSAEGLALMRLAEALLRVPDTETALALTADQLGRARFDTPGSDAAHPILGTLANQAVGWSKKLLPEGSLFTRLGAQAVVAAAVRAIQLLGHQFVLGEDIDAALRRGERDRRAHPQQTLRFSFDMLGEGARSDADARRYHAAYAHAISRIAAGGRPGTPEDGDGISIKLSALDARYEWSQAPALRERLLPRLIELIDAAAQANLALTIDAEESDRLELSLHLFEDLCRHVQTRHPGWTGLGLAVQAYQTRAPAVVDAVIGLARQHGLRLMVRLVKGAYWDGEIKRAQELGLAGYPVWTHKRHTDLAYLACARALLAAPDAVYAQFATHNAATLAAVLHLAERAGHRAFELQRLHGMGEAVYREALTGREPALRVYAPVGQHRDLLAYLVRRLLENGANASFVHQLNDESTSLDTLLAAPWRVHPTAGVALPRDLFATEDPAPRLNSSAPDLSVEAQRQPVMAAIHRLTGALPAPPAEQDADGVARCMASLSAGFSAWQATPLAERCDALMRAADALQTRLPEFTALLVHEARKTPNDALAEVREAIDFCRYYAGQARHTLAERALPGPTGERNRLRSRGRGVFVCISPWNFPLAIFTGQVIAALVTGNTVAAKPAEQTPRVAAAMVALLHEAGIPVPALQLCPGLGETVGAALVAHPACAGVCFTGSTAVARHIQRALAAKDGPIVPLIAETGGLNALIADSSALPEQVVDAVVQSAFRSAGQRCSALRLLCVHEAVAEPLLHLLAGAMMALRVGPPEALDTDVGPVIDAEALAGLAAHTARLDRDARLIARTPMDARWGASHLAPVAYEVASVEALGEEIFGPVLQVVRWRGEVEALVDRINGLAYGLTLGVHTRIDSRAEAIAARARVGNVYVNRNLIGAVVGSQPFGGEGLSGTGPKAGGPHYLQRFCSEQTVTVNTAAAGGNAELLAQVQ